MVIFDENNKSIQIKRFLSKSTRVPHAKFYICKKVIFFENFDYRATLKELSNLTYTKYSLSLANYIVRKVQIQYMLTYDIEVQLNI